MAEYLEAPRFVVTEVEGWVTSSASGSYAPMLAVSVLDRAYCFTSMREWRQEEYRTGGRPPSTTTAETIRARIRWEATALCAELNAKYA